MLPRRPMLMQNLSFPENVDRENNKDYNQVLLDVQRSLRRFPPGELIPVQSSVFVSYYSLDHICPTKPAFLVLYSRQISLKAKTGEFIVVLCKHAF